MQYGLVDRDDLSDEVVQVFNDDIESIVVEIVDPESAGQESDTVPARRTIPARRPPAPTPRSLSSR